MYIYQSMSWTLLLHLLFWMYQNFSWCLICNFIRWLYQALFLVSVTSNLWFCLILQVLYPSTVSFDETVCSDVSVPIGMYWKCTDMVSVSGVPSNMPSGDPDAIINLKLDWHHLTIHHIMYIMNILKFSNTMHKRLKILYDTDYCVLSTWEPNRAASILHDTIIRLEK